MYEPEGRTVQDRTRGKGKARGPRTNRTCIGDAVKLITLLVNGLRESEGPDFVPSQPDPT